MAKRNYSSKKQKRMDPAVQTVTLITPTTSGGATGSHTIDLSQVASLINRRFYRQGINWAVAGFKIFTATPGSVSIHKLQNTWVTSNAWEKAFRAWNKQQMEAVEDAGSESAVARFRDFKVHMDVTHVTAGFAGNLLPSDSLGNPAIAGEWEASQIVLPNFTGDTPAERFLHMNGINVNGTASRGVIEGYADSRAYPQSPDPVSPDMDSTANWLARMFDDGNDIGEVLENATDRNDNLPYDQENYPGGQTNLPGLQIHDQSSITATTIGGTTRLKGGNFPCGLIRVQHIPLESANLVIQIDLVPGTHRGYLCEPMTEM
ncbi:MAG: hypothetical protein [Circular genetic element sp.]|nr:MAG: hypothetical protein [Circular genetic element sp.]